MSVFTNDVVSETLALDASVQALTKPSDTQLVDGSAHTQPVSGTVTANAGTGTFLVDGSAHTQPVSGTVIANAGTGTMFVDGSAHTQPVSGTISVGNVVSVITAVASTATLTITTLAANTSTLVLPSNASRKSAVVFIPKAATSIKYGSGASASSFTYLTGGANSTIVVTGYTGDIYAFGPVQAINATELV